MVHIFEVRGQLRPPCGCNFEKKNSLLLKWTAAGEVNCSAMSQDRTHTHQFNIKITELFHGFNGNGLVGICPEKFSRFTTLPYPGQSLLFSTSSSVDATHSDINECTSGSHKCWPSVNGGNCRNTIGSHECSCLPGYIGNGVQLGTALQNNEEGTGCGKCLAKWFLTWWSLGVIRMSCLLCFAVFVNKMSWSWSANGKTKNENVVIFCSNHHLSHADNGRKKKVEYLDEILH